jgi:hypothetical protein
MMVTGVSATFALTRVDPAHILFCRSLINRLTFMSHHYHQTKNRKPLHRRRFSRDLTSSALALSNRFPFPLPAMSVIMKSRLRTVGFTVSHVLAEFQILYLETMISVQPAIRSLSHHGESVQKTVLAGGGAVSAVIA